MCVLIGNNHTCSNTVFFLSIFCGEPSDMRSIVATQVSNPNSHHLAQYDGGPGLEQACFDSLPIWPAQQGIDIRSF